MSLSLMTCCHKILTIVVRTKDNVFFLCCYVALYICYFYEKRSERVQRILEAKFSMRQKMCMCISIQNINKSHIFSTKQIWERDVEKEFENRNSKVSLES